MKCPIQIDAEEAMPRFIRHLVYRLHGLARNTPGTIHQDVNPALSLPHLSDKGVHLGGVRDVACGGAAGAMRLRLDGVFGFLQVGAEDVAAPHACAFPCEFSADRSADPMSSARDEGDVTGEPTMGTGQRAFPGRGRCHCRPRSRGSSRSRRPSPMRLKPTTVTRIARPGKVAIHGAVSMNERPVASIDPHSGVGGLAPSPRNESPAVSTIMKPTVSVAMTMIGE